MWSAAALLAASLLPSESLALSVGTKAAVGTKSAEASSATVAAATSVQRALRTSSAGFVEPMHFDQKLLICNAYPSTSPAVISKNGKQVLSNDAAEASIGYQQCRYLPAQVQKHDRLDFGLNGVEVEGSFQVGDLPSSDAVLLLVLERHGTSSMISFQSFAFPKSADRQDAQLAVINAFSGNTSLPRLRMEDHISGKEIKTVAKRVEQLSFNRVYSVEAGEYDASVMDTDEESSAARKELERKTKRLVKMAKSGNYVLLRTGGGDFEESLVVFPEPVFHSGAPRIATSAFALVLAIFASVFVA